MPLLPPYFYMKDDGQDEAFSHLMLMGDYMIAIDDTSAISIIARDFGRMAMR